MSKRTVVLLILDGWGIGPKDASNPIYTANPENFLDAQRRFPFGALQASGISVGLPWGEEGNSEVGHLCLGTGRVVYQSYPKITIAIQDGSFFKNPELLRAMEHAKTHGGGVNFAGLLTSGHVHAAKDHLKALISLAENYFGKEEAAKKVKLHLFSDGEDSSPQSFLALVSDIPQEYIGSISGRFYAMDRDENWQRTERAYRAMTGDKAGEGIQDISAHVQKTYARTPNDQFIDPVTIHAEKTVQDGDSIVFFNFREERARQIVLSFIEKDFKGFPVKKFSNLFVSSFVPYREDFAIPAAFPPERITRTLGEILSENGRVQLRITETQKYAHITYFFNARKEEPYPNEYRVLIPSKKVVHQEEDPQMRVREIADRLISAIQEGAYDFILVNFANADMVAHTGNAQSCEEAVRAIDEQIGRVVSASLLHDSILLITADHGNIERIYNPTTGVPETKHDISPVPLMLIAKEFEKPKDDAEIARREKQSIGILADVAPSILEMMGIPKPKEMTGKSALRDLIL